MPGQLARLLDHLNAEPHRYGMQIVRGRLSESPDDLWELLCTWPQSQLDDLIVGMTGRSSVSTNKLRALQTLRPLVEAAMGARITYASPHEGTVKEDQPTKPEKESTMQTQVSSKKKHPKQPTVKAPTTKKQAAPKLQAKSAVKAPVTGDSKVTVSSVIRAGIAAGKETEVILKDVHKKFPDSKATAKDVSWHRWKMREAQ